MSLLKVRNRGLALLITSILILVVMPGISLAKSPEGPSIHLQYASFDPLGGEPYVPAGQRLSGTDVATGTYLLQFSGPVRDEWKVAVEQAGVSLYGYVPDYAFIARMDGAVAAKVGDFTFVRWIGLYHPAYRLSPALQYAQFKPLDSSLVILTVQTLPDVDLEALAVQVEAMGGTVQSQSGNQLAGYLRVTLPTGRVDDLASHDGVLWVEPYIEPALYNDVGGANIMQAAAVRASNGLYGSGQIVAVGDSGLDVGATGSAMSDDFEGRIVAGQAICALFTGGRLEWSDLNAHGTHVSGSVLGSGTLSGSDPTNHNYATSYAGVAPEAQIVFQSLSNDADGSLECIPLDMTTDLFGSAYNLGARIHTNSWGGPSAIPGNPYGVYTLLSQEADNAAWNYKDMLILYAAGNDGTDADKDGTVDLDSVGSPGTAKNPLTVGATENERPSINATWGNGWILDFPVNPIRSDLIADNPSGMAAFSSRGPTDDGRIKPDVVAPGTYIISALGAGVAHRYPQYRRAQRSLDESRDHQRRC
jgi:hypothetical protein